MLRRSAVAELDPENASPRPLILSAPGPVSVAGGPGWIDGVSVRPATETGRGASVNDLGRRLEVEGSPPASRIGMNEDVSVLVCSRPTMDSAR